jgi:dTMP kinase
MANSNDLQFPFRQPSGPVSRGAFIVLEGLDRSGKTTQVKLLCDKLYAEGHNVKTLRFPGQSGTNLTNVSLEFTILDLC